MKISIRFNKENQIEFLKRKYTTTSHYYSWRAFSYKPEYDIKYEPRKYYASGKHIVQEIVRSAQAEGISIEEYVYDYNQFYAITDFYRPDWFKYLENRKKRHKTNVDLRKNVRSKDKRKKTRKEARKFKYLTIDEFFNNMMKK